MKLRGSRLPWQVLLVMLACVLMAACAGRVRPNSVAAPNVPTQFDVTVLADKDGQFDLDGATLAPEDLIGHINYRKEQGMPAKSLLLKPGEKQKVTDRHLGQLYRIHSDTKIQTFVQEKEGEEIQEVRGSSETP